MDINHKICGFVINNLGLYCLLATMLQFSLFTQVGFIVYAIANAYK